jgi:Prenyltransferase and squalene oxidase repeat
MTGTITGVRAERLHFRLIDELRARRRPDGGFSVAPGGASEVEPTAVAVLALRDEPARAWLRARQRADGGFVERDQRSDGPTTAALAALALAPGPRASRALRFAVRHRSLQPPGSTDQEQRKGWGWTTDARSTVEPTSRVLVAVDVLTPTDHATRAEAIRLLEARQCADGGWNYGNASVNDVDLRGYAQTTAVALAALQHGPRSLVDPGIAFLRETWPREPGGLTTAQAVVAFRLHRDDDEVAPALAALDEISRRPSFRGDAVALGWAVLASGPESLLAPLRSLA